MHVFICSVHVIALAYKQGIINPSEDLAKTLFWKVQFNACSGFFFPPIFDIYIYKYIIIIIMFFQGLWNKRECSIATVLFYFMCSICDTNLMCSYFYVLELNFFN